MTDELLAKIDALSDSELVEAGCYYLTSRLGVSSADEIEDRLASEGKSFNADLVTLQTIQAELEKDRDSYRQLLRFLLRQAAREDDEQRQALLEAIEGAGQKQVVVELALAIALGSLATMYLIHKTEGKISDTTTRTTETLPDGTIKVSVKHETIYVNAGSALGHFFGWLKAIPFS